MNFLPRDFIETSEGLLFAVVDATIEDGKVLCLLRYDRNGKLDTDAAYAKLSESYPGYLHHSTRLDADIHAVPVERILRHYQPRQRVREILANSSTDAIIGKLARLLKLLTDAGLPQECFGITGSLLIGRQTQSSDLDVVIYGRKGFFRAVAKFRELVEARVLDELDTAAWLDAYQRRGCELSFEEYQWYERRKGNKGVIDGTKFDLILVHQAPTAEPPSAWHKTGPSIIQALVLDDAGAFDHPARYVIDHPEIGEVLSFTHTYAGQAKAGEIIKAAGRLEVSAEGRRRLVIGSSREAQGEYIRVV